MRSSLFNSFILLSSLYNIKTIFAYNSPHQDTCPTAPPEQRTVFINGFQCKNPATILASDFKTSRMNHAGDIDNFRRSSMNFITAADFPGLNTLGISIARTDVNINGMVMPHLHPRASEMFYVAQGTIVVGFVDTEQHLFERTLQDGDVFVIPRGLLHFSVNAGLNIATIYSVLNSQNPGVVSVGDAIFSPESDGLGRLVRQVLHLSAMHGNVTSDPVSS